MSNIPNTIDHLMNKATLFLNETKSILSNLRQVSTDEGEFSTEDKILTIQLLLQYRLSGEDALNFLLTLDHNVLYFLGIHPQHSAKTNRDRLAYAVGNEDLKQILNVLAILTGSLSKIIARYKNSHASFALKNKAPRQHLMVRETSKLLSKQNQFLEVLHQLNQEVEQILEQPAAGPIFDHIAALRGPISHFHQAIIHGLGQAEELYHQVNKTPLMDYELHSLLKKTEEVLHLMPSLYHPSNVPLKQFDHKTSEQLEQRAAAKRLQPFWG
ncbi:hypothetical protein [Legionella maceachernii]|uniref:Uncharacterized protein n=1 Tax=Legionella maceachernii TaxID=466 RepID=A0A0W0W454_9GAMM|nr:hypothetical protein [Legionella maceachernii]KTD27037.1 hypothetical protein Lmac_1285 [Legionella maceachernii]SKA03718.1 hypothetical protein SAMN02745128_01843 [Legionella maceachernii]SUP00203.1 Uncharacterised protein [Legionella maceachernii]